MRFDDINLELIRCFTTVAECQSFTAAGERLHKSQSAISLRLKKLEELLGHQLLVRNSRSVELSEDGKRFFPYAMRLLHLNEEAISALQGAEINGTLRLGIVEYFAGHRLPGLIKELHRKFPAVDFKITMALSSELFRALDANELDVIIAKADHSRMDGATILEEKLHWVHCLDDFDTENLDTEHLDSTTPLPLCLMPAPCIYRQHTLTALKEAKRTYNEVITSGSVLGLQAAIRAGLGIGVIGSSCLQPDMKILDQEHTMPKLPSVTICLFGPEREKSRLIEPVIQHLQGKVICA